MKLFFHYLAWHVGEAPAAILRGWGNILWFNLRYFSLGYLLKTLFAPWRRYQWSYGRGFDLGRYLEVFFSNLISRSIGAVIRLVIILLGLAAQALLIAATLLTVALWIALPVLIVFALFYGFRILL